MFQTDGPAHEKALSPDVFVFTRGVTKVRVSDEIIIVLLEYKVEGDRTDTEGLFQRSR